MARFSSARLARSRQAAPRNEMRGSIRVLMGSGGVASNRGKLAWETEHEVFAEDGDEVFRRDSEGPIQEARSCCRSSDP